MNILLSIKPVWFEKIKSGEKDIELRKSLPRGFSKGDKIFFYVSSPIKKILGYCVAGNIAYFKKQNFYQYNEEHKSLLKKACERSCVSKEEMGKYFNNSNFVYRGFKVNDFKMLKKEVSLIDIQVDHSPQNFIYLNNGQVASIRRIEKNRLNKARGI